MFRRTNVAREGPSLPLSRPYERLAVVLIPLPNSLEVRMDRLKSAKRKTLQTLIQNLSMG